MKIKKVISVLTAVTLLMATLGGCKSEDTKKGGTEVDGVYTPGDQLDLTVWNVQNTEFIPMATSTENIPKDWLEEKTKVKVVNQYGNDGGHWDVKLSRLIAGDTMPDIVYIASGQGPAHFSKLKEAGKLYGLTPELLQKYAPNVWNRVPENCWNAMTSDGVILGIPFGFPYDYTETTQPAMSEEDRIWATEYTTSAVDNSTGLHIRDDIAKKLFPEAKSWDEICALIDERQEKIGEELWDMPINSTEDFIQMFRDIAALNLTEDGKKVYAFGYSGGDLWLPLTFLGASMYGFATNTYISAWNPNTQEIVLPLNGELMKTAMLTQNRLLREGVFSPESLVQTGTSFKENVYNGLYAVTSLNFTGIDIVQINKELEAMGKSYRYRPLRVNIPQNEDYPLQFYKSPWVGALAFTTELSDDEVKQALNWINVQFSDEFEEILWWGTPEDGLYVEENGIRRYKDDRFNKAYIENDPSALSRKDCRGIGDKIVSPESEFYVTNGFWITYNRWNPKFMQRLDAMNSSDSSSLSRKRSVDGVMQKPASEVSDPPYGSIPEAVELWSKRTQWEDPFKMALTADSDEQFERMWNDAIKNYYSITDLDAMTQKMTEIARAQAKEMGISQ